MHDRERRELGRHRAAEVVLVVSVLNDVERRPVIGCETRERVLHEARVDGNDRGRVPDHPRLEQPLHRLTHLR